MLDLREAIPKPLSPYNNSLPELSSTDNIQEKYYELEFNDQNLHSLAVNHVTKLESLQNESNISHRNDAQKVLDSICEYIASIDPNASRVDHDKVDQLINTLTMLNDKSSTYENLGHSKHRNILRSDSLNIEISPNYEKISLDEKSYSSEPELPLYDFYDVY
ncbi:hypothetical protein RF11_07863 [Thelohanellus kitauei]|uniref:Uncharacterized protein n=1 Tax=Thelohanellus kitauei TaxID=669202 RepID=A0A0C2MFP7_THEKT|nr:hypothetical protein RF11_07863 [Thelohanellus kitauei]